MKQRFLQAGQIVNTHGIQGEVKIVPWCDTPEFLCQFQTLYVTNLLKSVLPGCIKAMSLPCWRGQAM